MGGRSCVSLFCNLSHSVLFICHPPSPPPLPQKKKKNSPLPKPPPPRATPSRIFTSGTYICMYVPWKKTHTLLSTPHITVRSSLPSPWQLIVIVGNEDTSLIITRVNELPCFACFACFACSANVDMISHQCIIFCPHGFSHVHARSL